ncbi:hypothetical protein Q8A67_001827 [Cirrhinus molitorella]|uniref:SPRY-associated domain-containing protein n=1 Tax=Cirrhinus molitorella TaxID=172907 RepID=A0AA88QCR9_9TELE|nr:hypothetical protein Q8A67_001827 [Cirrhinus molitorella]
MMCVSVCASQWHHLSSRADKNKLLPVLMGPPQGPLRIGVTGSAVASNLETQLMKTQKDVQQMILDRIRKIQDIEYFAELRKKSTEQEKAASVELFSDLMHSIERCQAELLEMMEEKQKAAEKQNEELIQELQQEITELNMRNTELDHLLQTNDHFQLLQTDPSVWSPPHTRNWPEMRMNTDVSVETLRRVLTELQETLDEKLSQTVLKRMQQHAVDVTLDPDTAHPNLILSNDGKQTQLLKRQKDVQQMIQDRIKKIQDIEYSAEHRKKCIEQEKAASVELFSDLMRSIERCQAELLEMMEEKQKAAEKQDEDQIQELQQEITELKMRNTELNHLLQTNDHFQLLQIDPSLCSPAHTRNWPEIRINTDVSVETLRRALTQLQETLDEKLTQTVLRRMQQYSVDVTLDPDTAHPNLILSDDGKQVTHGDIKQNLSNNAERDDQTYVCVFCTEGYHKTHNTVTLEDQSKKKKSQLMKTQKDMQQMIQDRIKKIQDIKRSAELRKSSAEQEKAASVELFSDLMRSIERCQAELLEMMEEKQKAAEKQDEKLIQELQQEITELSMRNTELDHLLHTEDHLHLLQIDPSLCSPPHTRNWSEISMNTDVSVETLRRALTQLQETLDEKLSRTVLRRMEQYAVDLTLDPDTAHPYLILSNDGKQIFKDCEHSLYSLTALKVKSNGRFFINVNKTDLETDYGYASIFILH